MASSTTPMLRHGLKGNNDAIMAKTKKGNTPPPDTLDPLQPIASPEQPVVKSNPSVDSPEQPADKIRRKGRPTRKEGEGKAKYNNILADERLIKTLSEQRPAVYGSDEEQKKGRDELTDKLLKIVSVPRSRDFYYKLVFSYAYYAYRDHQEALQLIRYKADPENNPKPVRVTLKNLEEETGIKYFNMRLLFRGRGNGDNILSYLRFLQLNDIDYYTIAMYPPIIKKAYTLYFLLANGIDPGDVDMYEGLAEF